MTDATRKIRLNGFRWGKKGRRKEVSSSWYDDDIQFISSQQQKDLTVEDEEAIDKISPR